MASERAAGKRAGRRPGAGAGRPLKGARAWLITDGKAGHMAQLRGVAGALGLDAEIRQVAPGALWRALAPWGPVGPGERFGKPGGAFAPPWPDIALAAGRLTIPYIRALARRAGRETFTVVLQDPRTGAGTADLVAVPAHDRLRGPNVVVTPAAPHAFTPARLEALRRETPDDIAALPRPRVAVMLGGANRVFRYTEETCARLQRALAAMTGTAGSVMITPSRRTPAALLAAAEAGTRGHPRLVWEGEGENPYPQFLAQADMLVVTGDSVSMASEACATGRPVYVFMPEGGSAKFARFHAALREHGAARPLPESPEALETWEYEPLDAASAIAAEIERRWAARDRGGSAEE